MSGQAKIPTIVFVIERNKKYFKSSTAGEFFEGLDIATPLYDMRAARAKRIQIRKTMPGGPMCIVEYNRETGELQVME